MVVIKYSRNKGIELIRNPTSLTSGGVDLWKHWPNNSHIQHTCTSSIYRE